MKMEDKQTDKARAKKYRAKLRQKRIEEYFGKNKSSSQQENPDQDEHSIIGYGLDLPESCIYVPEMFHKTVLMEEEVDHGEIMACQQKVHERRKGKKCKLCWRRGQGLPIDRFMKHDAFCFAPLSDDSESCYAEFDRYEPDAAEDDFDIDRDKQVYNVDKY